MALHESGDHEREGSEEHAYGHDVERPDHNPVARGDEAEDEGEERDNDHDEERVGRLGLRRGNHEREGVRPLLLELDGTPGLDVGLEGADARVVLQLDPETRGLREVGGGHGVRKADGRDQRVQRSGTAEVGRRESGLLLLGVVDRRTDDDHRDVDFLAELLLDDGVRLVQVRGRVRLHDHRDDPVADRRAEEVEAAGEEAGEGEQTEDGVGGQALGRAVGQAAEQPDAHVEDDDGERGEGPVPQPRGDDKVESHHLGLVDPGRGVLVEERPEHGDHPEDHHDAEHGRGAVTGFLAELIAGRIEEVVALLAQMSVLQRPDEDGKEARIVGLPPLTDNEDDGAERDGGGGQGEEPPVAGEVVLDEAPRDVELRRCLAESLGGADRHLVSLVECLLGNLGVLLPEHEVADDGGEQRGQEQRRDEAIEEPELAARGGRRLDELLLADAEDDRGDRHRDAGQAESDLGPELVEHDRRQDRGAERAVVDGEVEQREGD